MAQKFRKLQLVHVSVDKKEYPQMRHFPSNFYGIVSYSYKQKYGGDEPQERIYSVIVLNSELTKAVNQIAWYMEENLSPSDKLTREQVENLLKDLQWIK